MVKNLPTSAGDPRDVGSIPGSGRSPRVGNGNRILAWKIPWTQEAGGLQIMRPQRVRYNWATKQIVFISLLATVVFFSLIWLLKIQNASQICVSSLSRGNANLLCIVPILVWKESESVWHTHTHKSRVRLFATPWTVAYQAPQSMEFSRQEYWSGLPKWAAHILKNVVKNALKTQSICSRVFCITISSFPNIKNNFLF